MLRRPPKKKQQVICDVLRSCEGVANIADDVVVHGKGVEEHDRRLFALLDRLSEVGLTLSGDKCDGDRPSEEKIAAIRDARSPKDASEVRSFMGLVQHSAKFIRLSILRKTCSRFGQKRSSVCIGCRTAESV